MKSPGKGAPIDHAQKVERVLELVSRGRSSMALQRELAAEWKVSYRAVRRWIKEACDILTADLAEMLPNARAESVAAYTEVYEQAMAKDPPDHRSAVKALEMRDRVQGTLKDAPPAVVNVNAPKSPAEEVDDALTAENEMRLHRGEPLLTRAELVAWMKR